MHGGDSVFASLSQPRLVNTRRLLFTKDRSRQNQIEICERRSLSRKRLANARRFSLTRNQTARLLCMAGTPSSPRSRNHASLNKSKPNTAETSLLVSIVEAPVYAMKSQYEAFVVHGFHLMSFPPLSGNLLLNKTALGWRENPRAFFYFAFV